MHAWVYFVKNMSRRRAVVVRMRLHVVILLEPYATCFVSCAHRVEDARPRTHHGEGIHTCQTSSTHISRHTFLCTHFSTHIRQYSFCSRREYAVARGRRRKQGRGQRTAARHQRGARRECLTHLMIMASILTWKRELIQILTVIVS